MTIFGERWPGRGGGELGIQLGSVSARREVASVLVQLQTSHLQEVKSDQPERLLLGKCTPEGRILVKK